ncbi:hypothetical protein OIE69_43975 (plasmid) [Actinacidiphila glaucinigra]|uniref:hypothetical protein n=1 Tax=Actinacidiphila glaucinigra TaxID=235986 RepID=UPI002DDA6B82|nr:hypothetical protein [Actinacidiphila glaucinigra]WSD65864.1 hypothetical protein OIE69_43975 [Actinacidiphila glaucinigra]
MSNLPYALMLEGIVSGSPVAFDDGATARFQMVISPTGDEATEMILPCVVTDLAKAALELNDGDFVRISGDLILAETDELWIEVLLLERIQALPQPTATDTAHTACHVLREVEWEAFVHRDVLSGAAPGTACIRLYVSPTADYVDDLMIPCQVTNPDQAALALTELQDRTIVRVCGDVCHSAISGALWLNLQQIEIVGAPALDAVGDGQASLEIRDHMYVVTDLGNSYLSVFTVAGDWVGYASGRDDVNTKIEEYEHKALSDT